MHFLAGLRLILIAAALIGLLGGRSAVTPVVAAHTAMTMTIANTGHDCCGKASGAATHKAGLAGNCLGLSCSIVAPALLPAAPVLAFANERCADAPIVVAGLEGRSPPPPIEPPRA
ncbi:hypothetical protein [Pleomorphomonas sp. PLEO]|uniref:hypothetical protein n=1 Tax=Pleomorphomonas sp. PLEO TaxID=3239306 RepID=UPI00351E1290